MHALRARLVAFFSKEASTRSVSLVRIGWPLLLWSRLGSDFVLYQHIQPWRIGLSLLWYAATAAMFLGLFSRLSTAITGALGLFLYYGLGHQMGVEPYTHHHTYLLFTLPVLLALTPCGGSFSLDRALALRRGDAPRERGLDWGRHLIKVQLSAIYLFGAWSKTEWGHASGERMEQYFMVLYQGSDYPAWPGFHWLMVALSVTVILLEYAIALGIWLPSARKWILGFGVILHAGIYVSLPVATFSASMLLLYLLALAPETVHGWVARQVSGEE